jgi:hypothetical protein
MIRDFISEVKKDGMSRTNRYRVAFAPPSNANIDALQKVLLFCDQAQLPGVSYASNPVRTFGELREAPYDRLFETCTLSFYVDTNMKVKRLFDSWINSIQNPVSRTFNYYKSYTTDMQIEVQDINDMTRYRLELFECYPKSIGAIQLDYSSKEIMKLSVVMQYRNWASSATEQLPSNEVVSTNSIDLFREKFSEVQTAFNSLNPFGDIGNGFSLDRGVTGIFG